MIRVSLDKVKDNMKLGKTIYASDGKVLLAEGQELKFHYISKLKEHGIFWVYIEDEKTKDIVVHDIVSEQMRYELITTIKDTMQKMKKKKALVDIRGVKGIINNMIDELLSHKNLVINLQDLRSYDDYVYPHSVGVCILSLVTGIGLKYDELKLRDLGVGALLHDVGKMKVPPEVLNKPDKLTKDEWETIKKHTVWGFEMLRHQEELSLLSSHIAFQHHERCDGLGYPRGLSEELTIPFAKVVGIADVYDAITADRSYRKRFLPHEAMEIIQSVSGKQFDPGLVKKFFEHIAVYPVGTMVELNTGERGVVSKVITGFTFRPIVKVIFDENGKELEEPYNRNLMEEFTVFVTKVIE